MNFIPDDNPPIAIIRVHILSALFPGNTEQFGINIRATVTTTVPNFVRGALVPVSLLFQYVRGLFGGSFLSAGILVAVLTLGLAF